MTKVLNDSTIRLSDGRQLAYAEYGEQDGFPVFLFHGLPGSRLCWGYIPGNPYAMGLHIIAVDRPGYGQSDPKPGRSLLDWPDDIVELADSLKLGKFAIIGVSGGGPGAFACAWKIPDRLTAIGVVASPAPTNSPGVFVGMSKTNTFFIKLAWFLPWLSSINIRLLVSLIRRNPGRYIDTMQHKMHAADKAILARKEIRELLVKDFSEALGNGGQGMITDMNLNHGRPWGFDLREIKTKVYFWFCEKDRSVPPAMGRYLSESIQSNETQYVVNAGHLWIFDHLREVLEQVAPVTSNNLR